MGNTFMKRKRLPIALALAVCLTAQGLSLGLRPGVRAQGVTVPVPNGGFSEALDPLDDRDNNDTFDNWTVTETINAVSKIAAEGRTADGKSLHMAPEPGMGPGGVRTRTILDLFGDQALEPGGYTLEYYIKTAGVTPEADNTWDHGAHVKLFCLADGFSFDDNTPVAAKSENKTGSTDGWERMTVPFTVAEAADVVRIFVEFGFSTGDAYFTDFALTKDGNESPDEGRSEGIGDYPIPDYNFQSGLLPKIDGNTQSLDSYFDNWTVGEEINMTTVISEEKPEGSTGKSIVMQAAKSTPDGTRTRTVIDLYGDSMLPVGFYTLKAKLKTENLVPEREGDDDHGAVLWVDWFKDGNKKFNESNSYKSGTTIGSTNGWIEVKVDFEVVPEMDRIRVRPQLGFCMGKAFYTDFVIEAREAPASGAVSEPDFASGELAEANLTNPNALRGKWGAKVQEGTGGPHAFTDAFSIVNKGLPDGMAGALKINAKNGNRYQATQIIEELDPTIKFVVRAQLKSEDLAGHVNDKGEMGGAKIQIAFLDKDGAVIWTVNDKEIWSDLVVNGTTGWSEVSVAFHMPENAVDVAIVATVTEAAGTAYFTDFEIMPFNFYDPNPGGPDPEPDPEPNPNPAPDPDPDPNPDTGLSLPPGMCGLAGAATAIVMATRRRRA